MIKTGRQLLYIICMMIIGISTSWACGHPPPPQPMPPKIWIQNHGIDQATGKQNTWVGVEIDPQLFPINSPTICTCAIGLPSTLPPSVTVTEAKIAKTNIIDHTMDVLFEFDFAEDNKITQNAEDNALTPNQQWTGFSANVVSFNQPIYGPNEVLKLWFNIESEPGLILPLGTYGFNIGGDPDDPDHRPVAFEGVNVSEPESLAMIMIGTVMLLFLRRKNKQDQIASGILTV